MNGIQIFKNQEFGAIRTMSNEQGEVMFCAKDVCNALGYDQPRKAVQKHVDGDDGTKNTLIDSLGRKQRATFINESGLYALIRSSKLESAKQFKHWVTSEVLPAIRKQGGYMVARQGLAKKRNFEYHSADGELKNKTYLVWTERGRNFIHQLVISPQIAQINTDVLN